MSDLKQRVEEFNKSKFATDAKNQGLYWVVELVEELTEREAKLVRALKVALNAIEKTVIYSTGDGVWVNSRVKGSAMWGLQDADENVRASFKESARLNQEAASIATTTLKSLGIEGEG